MFNFDITSAFDLVKLVVFQVINFLTSFRINDVPYGTIIVAFFSIFLITRLLLSKVLGAGISASDMVSSGKSFYNRHNNQGSDRR